MHDNEKANGSASPIPRHADTPSPRDSAIDPKTGLTYAEIARHQRRVESTAEANANPLPGPLSDAFAPEDDGPIEGYTVRRLVAMDTVIFKRLNSPLYRQMVEMSKPKEIRQPTEFTDEEGWELFYQFTRPCAEVFELLQTNGRESFRALVIAEIGCAVDPVVVSLVANRVGRQVARSFATALKYAPAKAEGEGDTVFTQPPAESQTASAGGSITSPVS